MTGLEALDNLIATLKQLPKIAPPAELPGLRVALEAAQAARADVDPVDMGTKVGNWRTGVGWDDSD